MDDDQDPHVDKPQVPAAPIILGSFDSLAVATSGVRTSPGYALVKAAKGTKMSGRDLAYIGGRPSVPETAESIARIAEADGTTPKAWFDAALGVTG